MEWITKLRTFIFNSTYIIVKCKINTPHPQKGMYSDLIWFDISILLHSIMVAEQLCHSFLTACSYWLSEESCDFLLSPRTECPLFLVLGICCGIRVSIFCWIEASILSHDRMEVANDETLLAGITTSKHLLQGLGHIMPCICPRPAPKYLPLISSNNYTMYVYQGVRKNYYRYYMVMKCWVCWVCPAYHSSIIYLVPIKGGRESQLHACMEKPYVSIL